MIDFLKGTASYSELLIAILVDDDGDDDDTSGVCGWVLSFKGKLMLKHLFSN